MAAIASEYTRDLMNFPITILTFFARLQLSTPVFGKGGPSGISLYPENSEHVAVWCINVKRFNHNKFQICFVIRNGHYSYCNTKTMANGKVSANRVKARVDGCFNSSIKPLHT